MRHDAALKRAVAASRERFLPLDTAVEPVATGETTLAADRNRPAGTSRPGRPGRTNCPGRQGRTADARARQ